MLLTLVALLLQPLVSDNFNDAQQVTGWRRSSGCSFRYILLYFTTFAVNWVEWAACPLKLWR